MTARAAGMLALMLIAGTTCAAELGRMFFTPAQRESLDTARKKNIGGNSVNESEQSAAPIPQNVSVNGVIKRSDGKSTIWLNNRAVSDKRSGDINVAAGKNDGRVRLTLPDGGRGVDLKVGQTVEIPSGTVQESYLRRPAAKPDARSAPGRDSAGADVAKVTPDQPRETIKSDSVLQKRPPRSVERDLVDDASRDGKTGSK